VREDQQQATVKASLMVMFGLLQSCGRVVLATAVPLDCAGLGTCRHRCMCIATAALEGGVQAMCEPRQKGYTWKLTAVCQAVMQLQHRHPILKALHQLGTQ
jgi:hypothetical protein